MGIRFYTCSVCEDNFPDCGTHTQCGECRSLFCSCCMKNYNIIRGECEDEENEGTESTCPFCTLEMIEPKDLLKFALIILGKTQVGLENEYRANKKTDNL